MFIPLRCDAPLYHRPWGTLGIMALCLGLHLTVGRSEAIFDWLLEYGRWNPVQWVSSVLVHGGWLHLLGNLVFFWVFGLIVEGKVGWWRFLLINLAIAVVAGGIEQTVMLGTEGGSLGLSGVIFGLLTIALLWAPENEIDVLLLAFPVVRHFEVKVRTMGLLYLGLQVLGAALDGFRMGTAMLHLLGAVVGLPIGLVMLRRSWVDCEGWDLLALRRKRLAPSARTAAARAAKVPAAMPTPRPAAAPAVAQAAAQPAASVTAEAVGTALDGGRIDEALDAWRREPAGPAPAVRYRLAAKLVEAKRWRDAEAVAETLLSATPRHQPAVLLMAWVLVQLDRPAAALELLATLGDLPAAEAAKRERIRSEAERRRAVVPYEMA